MAERGRAEELVVEGAGTPPSPRDEADSGGERFRVAVSTLPSAVTVRVCLYGTGAGIGIDGFKVPRPDDGVAVEGRTG